MDCAEAAKDCSDERIIREPFDYTKWQHERFDDVSLDEFCDKAVDYCRSLSKKP